MSQGLHDRDSGHRAQNVLRRIAGPKQWHDPKLCGAPCAFFDLGHHDLIQGSPRQALAAMLGVDEGHQVPQAKDGHFQASLFSGAGSFQKTRTGGSPLGSGSVQVATPCGFRLPWIMSTYERISSKSSVMLPAVPFHSFRRAELPTLSGALPRMPRLVKLAPSEYMWRLSVHAP